MIPTEQANYIEALEVQGIENADEVARKIYDHMSTVRIMGELERAMIKIKNTPMEIMNNKHIEEVYGATNQELIEYVILDLEEITKELRVKYLANNIPKGEK